MATTNRSHVMSVFNDNSQAQQAMDELQRTGFRADQIRYSVRKSGTGIQDSLENLGLPEQEAAFYNREFEAGNTVVMVNTSDRQQEAYDILSRNSGYDFNTRGSQMGDYTSTANTDIPQTANQDEQRLKLREEQLNVQKQSVEAGEARLRKDVVSEQQSIDVPVTHEEVYVERRPGSGQPSDAPIGENETYRVPVREEQVTASKQTVETGEVAMGKRQFQDRQRDSETVQREEAHVECSGDVNVRSRDTEENVDQSDRNDL
jgi:uncharacterized protein (TIGR02271 family)